MGSGFDIEKRESEVASNQHQHRVPVGFFACKDEFCKRMLIASYIGELHLGKLRILLLLMGGSYDDSIKCGEGKGTVFD